MYNHRCAIFIFKQYLIDEANINGKRVRMHLEIIIVV